MLISSHVKNIFITGGAGFIGSHFADALIQQGKKITVFDNLSSGKQEFLNQNLKNEKFRFVIGDLLNKSQLKKALDDRTDIVFHLAANPDISKGIENPTLDFNQTIIATFNLLQVMK